MNFIPSSDTTKASEENLGIFANDFAFMGMKKTPTEDKYTSYEQRNILEIIWQFETDDASTEVGKKQLVPTFPVLIAKNDFLLENYEPVEVGITYGFDYWSVRGKDIE